MLFLRKYNVTLDLATAGSLRIRFPIRKAGSADFATGSDWTPATGDVKVSKDGGAQANIGTLPTYSNGSWEFILTGTELSARLTEVHVVDSATKAVDDEAFNVETFGNASAMFAGDYTDAVRRGMTALPAAATGTSGGFPTFSGTPTVNGSGTLTITGAVATQAGTLASTTNITAGTITTTTNLTNAPTNGDLTATMKTSVTTAATASTPVAASVTGNVGGNVVGSVNSVVTVVSADMVSISGDSDAADRLETVFDGTGGATLSLGALSIVNPNAGAAITIATTNGPGVDINALGGNGIVVGSDVTGVFISGGIGLEITASSGRAVYIASTASDGVYVQGLNNGIYATGGVNGSGLYLQGGITSGSGLYAQSRGNNAEDSGIYGTSLGLLGSGFYAEAKQDGHGIWAESEGDGDGIHVDVEGTGKEIHGTVSRVTLVDTVTDVTNGGGGGTTITPLFAQTNNPRYSTRDLPPILQGSAPTDRWTITDAAGGAVGLSGKTVRFVAMEVSDAGDDVDSVYDDSVTGLYKYETSGSGIVVSGADNNIVSVTHSAANTATAGQFKYILWNATDKLPLASGKLTIKPAVFDV